METKQLFGRKQIHTDVETITAENVVEVLRQALSDHTENQGEIQYLWDYYCGKTPILQKTKEVRESINHKICVNRANEIVTFKRGYGFGEPIQYISRGTNDDISDEIAELNAQMFLSGKQAEDSALAEWLYVCGLGMRMALPGKDAAEPVHVYTLDPRHSFVVRYNGLGEPVVMGVKTIIRRDGVTRVHSVYTKDMYFEIENETIVKQKPHVLGMVPIFEYPANRARLGAFEVALPLLDALNEVESNRLDDVEQFVNSFLALLNGCPVFNPRTAIFGRECLRTVGKRYVKVAAYIHRLVLDYTVLCEEIEDDLAVVDHLYRVSEVVHFREVLNGLIALVVIDHQRLAAVFQIFSINQIQFFVCHCILLSPRRAADTIHIYHISLP